MITKIDWSNPPLELACTGCGVVRPTTEYALVTGKPRARAHPAKRSRRCRPCVAAELRERSKRKNLSARQRLLRGDDPPVVPTRTESALAEGGIARELYEQALRALAISRPVPVWERKEWFA